MPNSPDIIFQTEDGECITINSFTGITLSSEEAAVEISPQGINLAESVIQQHTNPNSLLDYNVLNSGVQITPYIALFGGPNPLGWLPGLTLVNPHNGNDVALRCIGSNIVLTSANIFIDDVPVATQTQIAALEERIKKLEDHRDKPENFVRLARHWHR